MNLNDSRYSNRVQNSEISQYFGVLFRINRRGMCFEQTRDIDKTLNLDRQATNV